MASITTCGVCHGGPWDGQVFNFSTKSEKSRSDIVRVEGLARGYYRHVFGKGWFWDCDAPNPAVSSQRRHNRRMVLARP